MASEPIRPTWQPRFSPLLISASVMLATFMEVLDTSVANVSLPHIAGSLAASNDEAIWVLTSYLVANAVVPPMTGWAAMCFGSKRSSPFASSFSRWHPPGVEPRTVWALYLMSGCFKARRVGPFSRCRRPYCWKVFPRKGAVRGCSIFVDGRGGGADPWSRLWEDCIDPQLFVATNILISMCLSVWWLRG